MNLMFRHLCITIACLPPLLMATAGVSFADDQGPTASTTIFEEKVRGILHDHCYECHSGAEPDGELRLDSSDGLRQGGSRGALIDAENPD